MNVPTIVTSSATVYTYDFSPSVTSVVFVYYTASSNVMVSSATAMDHEAFRRGQNWANHYLNGHWTAPPDFRAEAAMLQREERERVRTPDWTPFDVSQALVDADHLRAEAVIREERAKANAARIQANERADKLLIAHLSPAQQAQYARDKYFDVEVAGRRYRIMHGWAGNVLRIDERGKAFAKLCIHPDKQVPYADNLLAQKLLLEADEALFLRTANHTQLAS